MGWHLNDNGWWWCTPDGYYTEYSIKNWNPMHNIEQATECLRKLIRSRKGVSCDIIITSNNISVIYYRGDKGSETWLCSNLDKFPKTICLAIAKILED